MSPRAQTRPTRPDSSAILARLNPRQREAVEYCSGPLLVIAGPGTGKTRVISEKVLYLVTAHGLAPESILALTFTEKAAGEMTDRIRKRLTEFGISGSPFISTFHGYCYSLVQEHAELLGFRGSLRLLFGPLYVQFVLDQLQHLETSHTRLVERTTYFARTLVDFVSRCHDEGLIGRDLVKEVEAWKSTLTDNESVHADEVRDLAASLPILLERQYNQHVVSYGDLLTLAVRLLRQSESLRKRLQEHYKYILVDELQDNNSAQFELVNLLAEKHRRILVVGDEDQCIYRFRGAGLGLLERFQQQWGTMQQPAGKRLAAKPASGLQVVNLEENYRSTEAIITTFTTLIGKNKQRFQEKRLVRSKDSEANGPEIVALAHLETAELERRYLVQVVLDRLSAGRKPGEIAILCRSLGHVQELVSELRGAGVAVEVVGEAGLFSNPVVREIIAWLKALDNPGEEEIALYRVLRMQSFGLSHADQQALGRAARHRDESVMSLIEKLHEDPAATIPGVSPRGLRLLRSFAGVYRRFRHETQADSRSDLIGLINEIVSRAGLKGRLQPETISGRQNLAALSGLEQVAGNYEEHYPDPSLHGFMRFLRLLEELGHDETIGSPSDDPSSVKVMTVHQAKGREFPLVIVGGLLDRFPSQNRREWHRKFLDHLTLQGQDVNVVHEEEERRVLYVALSRAQQELLLSYYDKRDGKPVRSPSSFPEELRQADRLEVREVAESEVASQPPPATGLISREAVERRLHFLISWLGVHLHADAAHEALAESIRLLAALLAAAGDEAKVREALAALGLPSDWHLPTPEPDPLPCVSGPLVLSPSSMELYEDCPRKYYYRQVVGIPEPVRGAARYGTAVHKALELFHAKHGKASMQLLPDLLDSFHAQLAEVPFSTAREGDQARVQGQAVLEQYLREEAARADEIVSMELEKELRVPLEPDVTIQTRIDRLDTLSDGRVRIIDYKSGRLDSGPEYLRGFQMPTYAWAVMKALDKEVEQVEVIGLRELKETAKGRKVDRQILRWKDPKGKGLTPERLVELEAQMKAVAASIRAGRFDPQPSEQTCGWCPYRLLCEKAHGAVEDA